MHRERPVHAKRWVKRRSIPSRARQEAGPLLPGRTDRSLTVGARFATILIRHAFDAWTAPTIVATMLLCVRPAWAHDGPPFPILMDVNVANCVVSVWADPDIGEGKFFVILESPDGALTTEEPKVSMWVQPVNGRLERAAYEAKCQSVKGRTQYEARPLFDQRDTWNLGFEIEFSGQKPEELTAQVESTPPGLGPWGLLIYSFPFALVGGLWVAAMMRMRRIRQEALRQTARVVTVG